MFRTFSLISLFIFTFSINAQMTFDTGRGGADASGKADIVNKPSKTPAKVDRFNVFYIGDEYTDANSLTQLIQYMGVQVRKPFEIAPSKLTPPNWSLGMHLKNTELPKAFNDVKWDYVVIQENRTEIIDNPEKTIENATKLADIAKKNGAKPIFFMTWANKEKPEQSKEILKTYEELAIKNMARMSPVGIAWERAQKLAPHIELYREESEMSYPTAHGTYLTAACLFVTIFRQSPVGQKQTGFKTVPYKDALLLQKIAYKTVMDYEKYIMAKVKKMQEEKK